MSVLNKTANMDQSLSIYRDMDTLGHAANEAARLTAFTSYYNRKSINTRKAMRNTLGVLSTALATDGVKREPDQLFENPEAWRGITHGLVEGFQNWCLESGYAVSGINTMLSHIKIYCRLAVKGGVLSQDELYRIRDVKAVARREIPNINAGRRADGTPTRRSAEKDTHTAITRAEALTLKQMHPNTPRGRRNRVMMCVLLDHGLRADELAKLTIRNVKLASREIEFYRSKSDAWQAISLSADLHAALLPYLQKDAATSGPLLLSGKKHCPDDLNTNGMTRQRIFDEVRDLGIDAGIEGALSPHDCRVYWAITSYRHHKDIARLQREGGWSSPAMPMHYMQEALRAEERELRGLSI